MSDKKQNRANVTKKQEKNKKETVKMYVRKACQGIGILFFLALFAYFLRNKGFYLERNRDLLTQQLTFSLSMKTVRRIPFALLISGLGIFMCLKPNKIREKISPKMARVIYLLSPMMAFYILEFLNESKWYKFGFFVFSMNVIILYFVFFTFVAVLGNMKRGSIATVVLSNAFAVVNYFVYQCRGIAFLASDIKIAGTAVGVMGNYDYSFNFSCVYSIAVTILAVLFYGIITQNEKTSFKKYFVRLGVWAVTCVVFVYSFMYTDLIKGVYFRTFRPDKTYTKSGQALTFVRSFHMIMTPKPENYDASFAEEVFEKYGSEVVEAGAFDFDDSENESNKTEVDGAVNDVENGKLTKTTEENPNIIIVMNEAFSDLGTVGHFEVNQDYMPFIHSLSENTIKGTTYVSIYGGRTANSEYELLTGNSMAFLPDGTTTYQFFLKDNYPNFVHYLKNKGYQGFDTVHPYYRVGYNRVNVYNYFGFENFYDIADFENPKKLRKYITDESNYEKMIDLFEQAKEKSDAPYFSFSVTMQNHSSFDQEYLDMPHDIVLSDPYFYFTADQYLNLVKVSDSALEKFIEYFKGVDEPTLIIFFGDHQPTISSAFYKTIMGKNQKELTDEENMEKYKTPFLAWANYDIPEKDGVVTSLNYLISTIFDELDMDMPKYNKLLLEFRKEIPILTAVGYRGADGKYYSLDDETSPYKEVLDEYNILQYNELFDRDHWVPALWDDEYVQ